MKPIVPAFLLMLFAHSLSFASTNCQVVDYVDRSEVICIGDETAAPELAAPAAPSRATIADYIAQNQVPAGSQATEPAPSPVMPKQAAVQSGVTSHQTTAPSSNTGTAAENLAKRRELATRNTRNLMNYTSASTPPGQ